MTKVSLLQIGFGNFGRKWVDHLIRSEKIGLTGIVDTSPESRAVAKSEYGIDTYPSVADALQSLEFDAVLIVTPPKTHAAIAEIALKSGKHVLVEKPLSNDLNQARRVVAQAANLGRVLMVNQQYRFHAAIRSMREMIRSGEIGQLLNVRCRFDRDVQRWLPPTDFRITMEHGFLVDMGVHHIDLLRALTGQEIVRVYAEGWRMPNSVFAHHAAMTALLTLESGAVALYQGNWASNDTATSWHGRWDIEGTGGHLAWHPPEDPDEFGQIVVRRLNGDLTSVKPVKNDQTDGLFGVLHEFAHAVATRQEPETNGADNLRTLATVTACATAIEEHRVVAPE